MNGHYYRNQKKKRNHDHAYYEFIKDFEYLKRFDYDEDYNYYSSKKQQKQDIPPINLSVNLNVNCYCNQKKSEEEESLDTFIPPFEPPPPTTPLPRSS